MKNIMEKLVPGEKVTYKGEERIVQTSVKNFSTKKTVVHLKGDALAIPIPIEQIKKIKEKKAKDPKEPKVDDAAILELRVKYSNALQKEVPANKKNDVKWMEKKIAAVIENTEKNPPKLDWTALGMVQDDNLVNLIAERELDIDVEEYEHADDIRVAIATELDIDIPEED